MIEFEYNNSVLAMMDKKDFDEVLSAIIMIIII